MGEYCPNLSYAITFISFTYIDTKILVIMMIYDHSDDWNNFIFDWTPILIFHWDMWGQARVRTKTPKKFNFVKNQEFWCRILDKNTFFQNFVSFSAIFYTPT